MRNRKIYLALVGLCLLAILILGVFVMHKKPVEIGTIQGSVLLGPTCPVERIPPDPNCAPKPYAANLELVQENDLVVDHLEIVKKFGSTKSGTFMFKVAPGNYKIVSLTSPDGEPTGGLPYCSSSQTIFVTAGKTSHVSITCDTGIR